VTTPGVQIAVVPPSTTNRWLLYLQDTGGDENYHLFRADLDGNMTSAAQALTDKDIDVLVDYISGLGAP